jgi:hypothetical protein
VVLGAILALLAASAFSQQQGGPYTLHPSVIPGGGRASTNANTRIEGSAAQHSSATSTAGNYILEAGFWPNAEPCPFALSPLDKFLTQSGGPGGITVIATASCSWTASTKDDWILITSEESGTGNGVVTFEARENFTGSARQAVINVSGFNHVVVQDAGLGEDCRYLISPKFQSFPASGGSGTINVTAAERCAWQAVSSVNWVTITSSSVGIGNGTVTYSVGANPGAAGRNATVIIGGQAFAVKQKGN